MLGEDEGAIRPIVPRDTIPGHERAAGNSAGGRCGNTPRLCPGCRRRQRRDRSTSTSLIGEYGDSEISRGGPHGGHREAAPHRPAPRLDLTDPELPVGGGRRQPGAGSDLRAGQRASDRHGAGKARPISARKPDLQVTGGPSSSRSLLPARSDEHPTMVDRIQLPPQHAGGLRPARTASQSIVIDVPGRLHMKDEYEDNAIRCRVVQGHNRTAGRAAADILVRAYWQSSRTGARLGRE